VKGYCCLVLMMILAIIFMSTKAGLDRLKIRLGLHELLNARGMHGSSMLRYYHRFIAPS